MPEIILYIGAVFFFFQTDICGRYVALMLIHYKERQLFINNIVALNKPDLLKSWYFLIYSNIPVFISIIRIKLSDCRFLDIDRRLIVYLRERNYPARMIIMAMA